MPNASSTVSDTLGMSPLALKETAVAPGAIAATSSGASRAPESTSIRTTVLPRLQMIDAEPRLVVESKRRFEPIRRLGEGGHGEVTGAHDQDIGRNVAIKRLRADVQSSPGAALRFAEEVRTIGQLEHPNIVPIHDVGVDEEGEYYFVMKYVEGETLEAVIARLRDGDAVYLRKYTP